jgi:hypothetical protein
MHAGVCGPRETVQTDPAHFCRYTNPKSQPRLSLSHLMLFKPEGLSSLHIALRLNFHYLSVSLVLHPQQ